MIDVDTPNLDKPTIVFDHQGKKVAITIFNQRPENFTSPPLYWAMPEYEDVINYHEL